MVAVNNLERRGSDVSRPAQIDYCWRALAHRVLGARQNDLVGVDVHFKEFKIGVLEDLDVITPSLINFLYSNQNGIDEPIADVPNAGIEGVCQQSHILHLVHVRQLHIEAILLAKCLTHCLRQNQR